MPSNDIRHVAPWNPNSGGGPPMPRRRGRGDPAPKATSPEQPREGVVLTKSQAQALHRYVRAGSLFLPPRTEKLEEAVEALRVQLVGEGESP